MGMPAEVRVKVSNGYLYDECKVRAWLALPGCPAHVTAARVAK
ncbi:hypothetical protein [Cyanobium sp. N5-Cardenillas]|nr:hypothetical protein [Cyanobium sp. N5-Cardenillas]